MEEDIDFECSICTEKYEKIRMPVVWFCCKQWTCRECAVTHLRSYAKGDCTCPFCRRESTMYSFGKPDKSSLTELTKQLNVPMHRKNITGSGLTCSQCLAEKISYEQLFIYFYDPGLIQCHILLAEEREKFDHLLQIAVCSVCLRRSCPVPGAPVLSLKDIFFVDEEKLVAYSHKFFKSGIQCSNGANAMTGAVLCWRWLYAMRCSSISCGYDTQSGIFIWKILKCTFWKNLGQAPPVLTDWRNLTDMSIVHMLSMFTDRILKKRTPNLVAAELFHLAFEVSNHLRVLGTTNILDMDLANKIVYPTFVRTLEDTTAEEMEMLKHRYEAMKVLIDFECYRNNKDKAADIWAMFRAESSRCANFESTDCLDFLNKKRSELSIRFCNYLRRPME